MMPWLGSPTSYASGYMSAHRTAADSQSFTCAFSSPPTYCTGFETRGSSGSRSGKIDGAVMFVQGSRVLDGPCPRPGPTASAPGGAHGVTGCADPARRGGEDDHDRDRPGDHDAVRRVV